MLADAGIHQRLGEGRLVGLVMAVAPVAEHVDDDRLAETLAVLDGDLGDMHHGLGIVAVHVEDRRVDHLGDVGGVGRGAREARRRGEADLIVDDEMQRAAGAVAAQTRKTETFGDHALAGEGGVAMQQERQHFLALVVVALVLLGPHLAEHHGIDDLEMRGVGGQRQMHAVLVELPVGGGAEMIFHVARAFDLVGMGRAALELVEDRPVGLAHDVGEHVQPSAMRHADDDLAETELAAALDDLLERRHRRLAAVQPEALGAGIFDVEEALEGLGLDQLLQDRLLAFRREADLPALDAVLDPGALLRVGDMHVLDADMAGIGVLQDAEHLAQRAELEPERAADIDRSVVIGLGEAVGLGLELGMLAAGDELERVELGGEMAAGADRRGSACGRRACRAPRQAPAAR